jgi:hypothetical protein
MFQPELTGWAKTNEVIDLCCVPEPNWLLVSEKAIELLISDNLHDNHRGQSLVGIMALMIKGDKDKRVNLEIMVFRNYPDLCQPRPFKATWEARQGKPPVYRAQAFPPRNT